MATKKQMYDDYLLRHLENCCWKCTAENIYNQTENPHILVCRNCGATLTMFTFKEWDKWRLNNLKITVQREKKRMQEIQNEIRGLRAAKKAMIIEIEIAKERVDNWRNGLNL